MSLKVCYQIFLNQEVKVAKPVSSPISWNKELIHQYFLLDESAKICNILIGGPDAHDSSAWAFSKDGVYTVKFGNWIPRSLLPHSKMEER